MKVMSLAVDVLLSALLGKGKKFRAKLLKSAQKGECELTVQEEALYWAMASVQKTDEVDIESFRELLQLTRIMPAPWLGAQDRLHWNPSQEAIERWRSVVLSAQD